MCALRRVRFADCLRRVGAAGGAALVLALTIFAASPVAHDWLHANATGEYESGCAVVLFAGGVSLPLDAPVVLPPATIGSDVHFASARSVVLVTPRYLRQPERGPPSLG